MTATATESKLFDMAYWLADTKLIYRAHRLGIKNIIPLHEVPRAIQKLTRDCIVDQEEALELLRWLKKEEEEKTNG